MNDWSLVKCACIGHTCILKRFLSGHPGSAHISSYTYLARRNESKFCNPCRQTQPGKWSHPWRLPFPQMSQFQGHRIYHVKCSCVATLRFPLASLNEGHAKSHRKGLTQSPALQGKWFQTLSSAPQSLLETLYYHLTPHQTGFCSRLICQGILLSCFSGTSVTYWIKMSSA